MKKYDHVQLENNMKRFTLVLPVQKDLPKK